MFATYLLHFTLFHLTSDFSIQLLTASNEYFYEFFSIREDGGVLFIHKKSESL